jgi:serine/threonine protein kinase
MAQGIGRTSSSSILSYSIPPSDVDGSFNLDRRLASDFANPTSDIYSLGHILFEMITGKDFNKLPPHSRLRDFIPGINPSLDDLLYSMMHESAGLRDLDASTVARKLQHELEIEEKAQREILSRKYDELAEWERLKNAELTRQKTGLADQQTKPVSDTKENNKPATEQEKIAPPEEEIELPDTTNDIASNKIDKKSKITKVSEVIEGSSKEQKRIFISKKIVLLSILLTAIVTVGIFYWNYLISIPEKSINFVAFKNYHFSPFPLLMLPPRQAHSSEVQLPVETAITPTQAFPSPSIVPPGGENGTSAIQNSKASSEIYSALNPGFEDTSAWTLRIGDSHILGKYTTEWASEGTGSYKIYMLGDANYEYCFLSGIRTTINQAVDLTDVDEVLFDLYLKPAVVMKDSQGNPVITKAVAFIDGEQLYKSVDNTEGFLPNQKLVLNKRFSGKHDLKIGLMTTYNFCVKGRNEADSLTLYIDNVRLITYQ